MEVFRIAQETYADDLSGNGARLFGGRWNSEGLFAVYTSSFRSLSLLETLAHTPAKMLDVKKYFLITLAIPDTAKIEVLDKEKLIDGWDAPDTRPITRRLGDQFLRHKRTLLLKVPSVLINEESNYLLNPLHPEMKRIKSIFKRRIYFDSRLVKSL